MSMSEGKRRIFRLLTSAFGERGGLRNEGGTRRRAMWRRPWLRGNEGSSLVEFAMVLPLMMTVLTGGASFSMALYSMQQLSNASASTTQQHGAQAGSVPGGDPCAAEVASWTASGSGTSTGSQIQPSATNNLNRITGNNPTSPTYPSYVGQCGQAVQAALAAANAGTEVVTIGYGSENSSGCCTHDTQYSYTTPSTWWASWKAGDNPCQALAAMASSEANFYSDNGAGCQATLAINQKFTKLNQIFQQIINTNMTTPRLIPSNPN